MFWDVDDADCMLCVQKTTHTDWSEVTNSYEMLCGCENGIFENVLTKEGEECKVSSIKTSMQIARYNTYDKRDKRVTIVSGNNSEWQ